MQDLGKKINDMESVPEKPSQKMTYPSIRLPLSMLGKRSVGDKVTVVLKGKIVGLEDTSYSKEFTIDAMKGEISGKARDMQDKIGDALEGK